MNAHLSKELDLATSFELDDDLSARLARLADQRRQPADEILTEAVSDYVCRLEARESFLKEADESWAEFQRTGQHITGQELFEWLRTWGTDREKAPPECHD